MCRRVVSRARVPFTLTALTLVALVGSPRAQTGGPAGQLYGTGCPSPTGVAPTLATTSPAFLGSSEFGLATTGVPAGAASLLLISPAPGSVPLSGGCTVMVYPGLSLLLPMPSTGAGIAGWGTFLPSAPGLLGTQWYFQAAAIGQGIGLSPGLALTMAQAECEWGTVAMLGGPPGQLMPLYSDPTGTRIESALPARMSLLPLDLAGFRNGPAFRLSSDARRVEKVGDDPAAEHIVLRDVGRLYRFRDDATGENGLVVAKNDAALLVPILASGAGASIGSSVAVSSDGRRLAALRTGSLVGDRVLLGSTDGVPINGVNMAVDVTPVGLWSIDPDTIALTRSHIVFVGGPVLVGGAERLFRGPVDGSAGATAPALPTLGDGSAIVTIDAEMLVADNGRVVFTARSSTASDVFSWDPVTDAVTNVTGFHSNQVIVESFGDGATTPVRAAFSKNGDNVFFTAVVGGTREAYYIRADGSAAGSVLGKEVTADTWFGSGLDEIRDPYIIATDDVAVRIGSGAGATDLYRLRFGPPSIGLESVSNVTATSGQTTGPFDVPGNIRSAWSFTTQGSRTLYLERQAPLALSRDLIGVDLGTWSVTSVTGNEFSVSPATSFTGISHFVSSRYVPPGGAAEHRTLMVTEAIAPIGVPQLTAFDARELGSPMTVVATASSGGAFGDVLFSGDGEKAVYVLADAGTSHVKLLDWATMTSTTVASIPGTITRASVRWIHQGFDTIAYAVGSNHPVHPTDAVVEHLALATRARKQVTTTPGDVVVLCGNNEPVEVAGPCRWTGDVDFSCTGTSKSSYINVTINAAVPTGRPISVAIEGAGAIFANGTHLETVPCASGTTRLDIMTGLQPGCYAVTLGGRTLPERIRIVAATPNFRARNGEVFSADNEFFGRRESFDFGLGIGTKYYQNKRSNTMELQYALFPKDGCRCRFDIKRNKKIRIVRNGASVGPVLVDDDDAHDKDEDLTPSLAGFIYSTDAPALSVVENFLAVGESLEMHHHFVEWAEIENKGQFERITGDFPWESHLFIVQVAEFRSNIVLAKCEISEGHEILLGPWR